MKYIAAFFVLIIALTACDNAAIISSLQADLEIHENTYERYEDIAKRWDWKMKDILYGGHIDFQQNKHIHKSYEKHNEAIITWINDISSIQQQLVEDTTNRIYTINELEIQALHRQYEKVDSMITHFGSNVFKDDLDELSEEIKSTYQAHYTQELDAHKTQLASIFSELLVSEERTNLGWQVLLAKTKAEAARLSVFLSQETRYLMDYVGYKLNPQAYHQHLEPVPWGVDNANKDNKHNYYASHYLLLEQHLEYTNGVKIWERLSPKRWRYRPYFINKKDTIWFNENGTAQHQQIMTKEGEFCFKQASYCITVTPKSKQ